MKLPKNIKKFLVQYPEIKKFFESLPYKDKEELLNTIKNAKNNTNRIKIFLNYISDRIKKRKNNNLLKRIISYWYDCIENEDILEKDISVNVRKKAILYPFNFDPFIFERYAKKVDVTSNEKMFNFYKYISLQKYDSFYGYPLLYFFNEEDNEYCVAPLFIVKVSFEILEKKVYLQKIESVPACGILAFKKLGFKTEEIAAVSEKIEKIFRSPIFDKKELVRKCLESIQNENDLPIMEEINPDNLSNYKKFEKNNLYGLYNKSLLFAGENTNYNIHLLKDLKNLKEKDDFENTALSFLVLDKEYSENIKIVPILPFPANEYQIQAIQKIFNSKFSVITGPPGTGKSQFICNLLVNIFINGKTAIFVSHTNEAIKVVEEKINNYFNYLIFRTGKKEYRQELKGKFNELLVESNKERNNMISIEKIKSLWEEIFSNRQILIEIDKLENLFEQTFVEYNNLKNNSCFKELSEKIYDEITPFVKNLKEIIKKIFELKNKVENNQYKFIEKIFLFFLPSYMKRKINDLYKKLNSLMPLDVLKAIRNDKNIKFIKDWNYIVLKKIEDYLELHNKYAQLKEIKQKIDYYPSKAILEKKIRDLENQYFEICKEYLKNLYIRKILELEGAVGKVNSFLNHIESIHSEEEVSGFYFNEALKVLKIWASTLKSIRRSFPLQAGIFDYIIFDEASQVDLASAAPALYRAKKVVIVGDPMQLTHIANITKEMDEAFAKKNNIFEEKEFYPVKVRYYDISLYKAAENSIIGKPIILINHYRSEEQIISLCNKLFYDEKLKILTLHDYSKFPSGLPLGVHWIDCEGEAIKLERGSKINKKEAETILNIFKNIIEKISDSNITIGIVTPYSAQEDLIADLLQKSYPNFSDLIEKHKIEVLTAHKFQGSEKDIIIFSMVLASKGNANSDSWFNFYPQILNVALSRAKYLLYIVGDKKYCYSRKGILKRIVETYDEIKKLENFEKCVLHKKFDSPTEQVLFSKLQEINFDKFKYELIPKYIVKGYTLDFALIGKNKIDIECDGYQHEIVEGLPIIEDVERDKILEREGWKVLRFSNSKILSNPEEVIKHILKHL